ncbi:hypothetical protein [Agathobacter sp.]
MKVIIDIPNDFAGDYIADKFKDFFSRVIADIDYKGMCGRYEKEIAEMFLKAFDDSKEKNACDCQHNSNSRDDEPCCRCDSRKENANMVKANSLEIIVRMIGGKPYYEVKYKEFGKKDYSIGYSSYSLKTVLGFIAEYFEIVESDKHTNADRIRNMSDEELADVLFDSCLEVMGLEECTNTDNCVVCERCVLNWLRSEAE